MLHVERVTAGEGRARLDAGEATALLLVPAGFGEALLHDRPARLELITNPAQSILPAILVEGMEMLVEGTFYAQRLVGDPLRMVDAANVPEGGSPSDAQVAAVAAEFNRRLRRLDGTLMPPLLDLELAAGTAPGASLDLGRLFLPGILFMSLLFVGQGMSDDIWKERTQGTLRRALSAPQPLEVFLAGKLLAATGLMAGVTVVGLAVGALFFEVVLWTLPLALLWCAFTGSAMYAFFLVLQLFASTPRGGTVLTTLVLFPAMMIGGSERPRRRS